MTDLPRALVWCALGQVSIDVETGELELDAVANPSQPRARPVLNLPLVVAADRNASRIVAVIARRPPLVISDDAGTTWREAGGGLPAGVDIAILPDHPDRLLYASETRVHLSRDGGLFWHALEVELPSITAVAWAS
jgi:hypothetical protein